MVGDFHPAPAGAKGPLVLILGGSEGGLAGASSMAKELEAEGFGSLALAYFKAPGLPQELASIPLETFDRAIAWLSSQPGKPRVILIGVSKGAEAALLAASRNDRVCAVVAGVPSSVAWPSSSPTQFSKPSWTAGGAPVPFLPYALGSFGKGGIFALYKDALPTLPQHAEAVIPVEKIRGPLLLISGKQDALWPSAVMGEQIMARLAQAKVGFARQHLSYENAGHASFGKPAAPGVVPPPAVIAASGGTADGNQAARLDSWPKMMTFLHSAAQKNCRS
jgi:dienelactone hydrolase